TVSETLLKTDEPLGLFVSAKASSAFYLNGNYVGANGLPSASAETEIVGKMDTVFYLPKEQVKLNNNELTFRISSHHGYIDLANPIHFIAIAPYAHPSNVILYDYLPSFLPLGILIVGALYFGYLATKSTQDASNLLVPLIALFAAAQLITEVSRGVFSYEYPFHDIRLVLILVCALVSAACLLFHIVDRFITHHKTPIAVVSFSISIIPVFLQNGFDGKTLFALQGPATVSAMIALYAAGEQKPKAFAYAIVLFLFSASIYFAPYQFLDIYLYYIVAGLILFLFVQQIHLFTEEKRLLAIEQARGDRLQLILDESKEKSFPSKLSITQAGSVSLIPTDKIAFCKGARDYVELCILEQSDILHSGTLTELEKSLPATFLRVHRSYIVNTNYIKSLERDTSGSGVLHLTIGKQVPVSRRIMPKVRKALT
ncbi:MAG: LytR/AlgR family response regulator transcription factor, partial [Kordiimonas sp.]